MVKTVLVDPILVVGQNLCLLIDPCLLIWLWVKTKEIPFGLLVNSPPISQLFSGPNSFSLFFGGCPTKMVQAQKRVPFFSRVTEQLRFKESILVVGWGSWGYDLGFDPRPYINLPLKGTCGDRCNGKCAKFGN